MDNLQKTKLSKAEILYLLSLSNQNQLFLAQHHVDPLVDVIVKAVGKDLDETHASSVETCAKALSNICTTLDCVCLVVKKQVIESCCGLLLRDTAHEGLHTALIACLRRLLVCRTCAQTFVSAGGLGGVKKVLERISLKTRSVKRTSIKMAQEGLPGFSFRRSNRNPPS